MKFGLFLANFDDHAQADVLMNFGIAADQAGWDGVFLADHLHYQNKMKFIDPWIMLAGLASRTKNVKLGTWVAAVPRRQPWQLARDLASLDQLSNGRIILGAGLGTPPEDYTAFGMEYDPKQLAKRFDESLDILDGLWSERRFSYDGDIYKISDVDLYPKPMQQPRIPILIAGRWPAKNPIERGARWDGIMPISQNWPKPFSLDEIKSCVEFYQSCRETNAPGDVVVMHSDDSPPLDEFIPFCQEIGVTWILFGLWPQAASIEEYMERIKQGPPKI
jgi:alkanesulfonate monooxygenase SsuD/methylene tetrahydromethanopterin reductase-like flavin-dependent oxidoreductase (luciferase family)